MNRAIIGLCSLWVGGCGLNANDPYEERPVVSLDVAPGPIEGGTLTVTRSGEHAVVADPDRDRVLVVDLTTDAVREIDVPPASRPVRSVEDGAGRVYVSLWRGGSLLEIDVADARVTQTIEVCEAPRGVAWDAARDRLVVACASGEVRWLGPDRTEAGRVTRAPDLRDVVVVNGTILLSRHRSAEVEALTADGEPLGGQRPPLMTLSGVDEDGEESGLRQTYEPHVAARLRAGSAGPWLLHQRARVGEEVVFRDTSTRPDSYTYSNRPVSNGEITWRDPCDNAVVHAAVTPLSARGLPLAGGAPIRGGVAPVDVAVSPSGRVAAAFAGEPGGGFALGPAVVEGGADRFATGCVEGEGRRSYPGQVTALAYRGETLVVQVREPALLMVGDRAVALGGASVHDTGHELFHLDTGGGIACASCHPGGADDGHVWDFGATSPVRTLPLAGSVGNGPYHRAGDVRTFGALMDGLTEQMAGPTLRGEQTEALRRWLEALPAPPRGLVSDPQTVDAGGLIFQDPDVGCAGCHVRGGGADGLSHDVGDGLWQTPALAGVALRAPYLHDGSAPTIEAAMAGARVGMHGDTRGLDARQEEQLLTFVRAL